MERDWALSHWINASVISQPRASAPVSVLNTLVSHCVFLKVISRQQPTLWCFWQINTCSSTAESFDPRENANYIFSICNKGSMLAAGVRGTLGKWCISSVQSIEQRKGCCLPLRWEIPAEYRWWNHWRMEGYKKNLREKPSRRFCVIVEVWQTTCVRQKMYYWYCNITNSTNV